MHLQQFHVALEMVNALKTTVLLAVMTALFMGVGYIVGGQVGMILALGVSVAMNAFAYWNADQMVLKLQNAEPVSRRRAPQLHDLVENLAQRAGIPTPRIYLIHSDQPNAFATGRNPENAAVAISTGLMQHLDMDEVAGVMAHELAHIRSRDTLTMTITATLAGAISMLAQFGFFFGGRDSNSPLGPVGMIAMIIIAPLAAMMVQMAVSRVREYEADKDGGEICGDPLALAGALEKISRLAQRTPNVRARRTPALAHMYIVNPLAGGKMDNLFSTHPDVGNRISALEAQAREMGTVRSERPGKRRAPQRKVPEATQPGPGWRVPVTGSRDNERETPGPWG